MTGPTYHARTHLPGGTDPINAILYDYYNDGGFLDVTTENYLSFINNGDGGTVITDTGNLGIGINSSDHIAVVNTGGADGISLQQIGGSGGISLLDSSSAGIVINTSDALDLQGETIDIYGGSGASNGITLRTDAIVDPVTYKNTFTVGTMPSGLESHIFMMNKGGYISIREQAGVEVHNLPGTLLDLAADGPISAGAGLVNVTPAIRLGSYFDNGTGFPAAQGAGVWLLYSYQRPADGKYELSADINGTRIVLAVSP